MTVKQLHEILGKYIDVGAEDWIVHFCQSDRFKTRKEHRDWLKSNPGLKSYPTFEVGEVIFADVATDDGGYTGIKYAVLIPSLIIKDEKRAFYHLPSQDYVKGKKITRTPKKLELVCSFGELADLRKKRTWLKIPAIMPPRRKGIVMDAHSQQGIWYELKPKKLAKKDRKHPWLFAEYLEFRGCQNFCVSGIHHDQALVMPRASNGKRSS